MSKVLYAGPFGEGTGYSNAAENICLSLDSAGVDVVARECKLCPQRMPIPEQLRKLLKKNTDNVDVLIQHSLPPSFVKFGGVKNIGVCHFETTNFLASNWQYSLNLMDEVWVTSELDKESCLNSQVKVPVKVVPIPCNFSALENIPKLKLPNTENKYCFYYIGDYSSRKNVKSLIKAYLSTFSIYDEVVLILKTFIDSTATNKSVEIIKNDIEQIKKDLRKFTNHSYYPKIILISEYLSNEQILELHSLGDCFVCMEKGTAWNLPIFNAMAFGNQIVTNGWGGFVQFTKDVPGVIHSDYVMTVVDGMAHCQFQGLYTSYETWAEPNFKQICDGMLYCYQNKESKTNLKDLRKNHLSKYSLENAGKMIRETTGL